MKHGTYPAVASSPGGGDAAPSAERKTAMVDAEWLRTVCLTAGADDVGFVHVDRQELADQRKDILTLFPQAKTLVSLVGRLSREHIRSPAGSIGYVENRIVVRKLDEVAHKAVMTLEGLGIRAMIGGSTAFPIEMEQYPDKSWLISHKPVAAAAGMGRMGLHRCIIHPKFGSFVVLGTVLVGAEVTAYGAPLDDNPCFDCKLCADVCPVGAIGADGYFNFSACFTYNHRELMGGFLDWVAKLTESRNFKDYRRKVNDVETVSMWQSLGFEASFKSPCCCAVCPAGEDVIGPFRENREDFIKNVLRPLQERVETVYVIPGSDAEEHVSRFFPHKNVKRVEWPVRPRSIQGFLDGLPLLFQPHHSQDIGATFHFTFTGTECRKATVIIQNKKLQIMEGHHGVADMRITADSRTWLEFVAKEVNVLWALLKRNIRINGAIRHLLNFRRCFPA